MFVKCHVSIINFFTNSYVHSMSFLVFPKTWGFGPRVMQILRRRRKIFGGFDLRGEKSAPQAEKCWGLNPGVEKKKSTWNLGGVMNLGGKFCSGLCGGKISDAKIILRCFNWLDPKNLQLRGLAMSKKAPNTVDAVLAHLEGSEWKINSILTQLIWRLLRHC